MQPVEWAALAAGVALVTGTLASVLHTLVLPRKPRGLAARAPAGVRASHLAASRRVGRYADKDRMLALAGPALPPALLLIWLITLRLGYALILWPLGRQTYGAAVVHAGSALFTLGVSSAVAAGNGGRLCRRRHRPGDRSSRDCLPADAVLGLQPQGGTGHAAGEPGRLAGRGVELLARHQLAGIWTGCRHFMTNGSAGRPTWRRATPPIRCSPTSARRGR